MKRNYAIIILWTFFCLNIFGQDTIRFKNYFRNLKSVDVSIAEGKYNFLFDSGGGETFVSPEIINILKKKEYGCVTGIRMTGEQIQYKKADSVTIKIGNTDIFHTTIGVWDVMNVLPKELPKIDGVISLKSFQNKIISLDFKNNWFIIETHTSFENKIENMILLNSRFANGLNGNELTLFLSTTHNQHLYWFLFDTGNIRQFIFSPQTAFEWGLQNNTNITNKEYSNTIVVFGNTKYNVNIVTENILYDGVINYDLISKTVYIINLIENQVWTN